jgi:transcriptional regulator with XRE-family HTH domain
MIYLVRGDKMETIAENIKRIRKQKGLTQNQLGVLSGIDEANIRKYENGRLNPSLTTIRKIAEGLGVALGDILPFEEGLRLWKKSKNHNTFNETIKVGYALLDTAKNQREIDAVEAIAAHAEEIYKTKHPLDTRLLASYELLNTKGKEKAVEYVEDLSKVSDYQKQETPNAAHERTDIEATEEMKKHDENF